MTGTIRQTIKASLNGFDWLSGLLDQGVRFAVMIGMMVMFLVIMLQVCLRYIFGIPLFWVPELAGFLLAFVALCGSSSCVRARMHVKVTVLYSLFPSWLRHLVIIIAYAVVAYYAWAIYSFGLLFAELGQLEYSPSQTFNLYWPRMALTVGGILIMVQAVSVILREFGILIGLYDEASSHAGEPTAE